MGFCPTVYQYTRHLSEHFTGRLMLFALYEFWTERMKSGDFHHAVFDVSPSVAIWFGSAAKLPGPSLG